MAHSQLNQRLADQNRHNENRGRLAHVYHRVRTDGFGTVEFEARVNFGLTFVERPFIAYGSQVDMDQAREAYGVGIDADIYLPQASGYVTEWDKTDRDHYVGCWVAVSVSPSIDGDSFPMIRIQHDFTWSAVAIKDVPTSA